MNITPPSPAPRLDAPQPMPRVPLPTNVRLAQGHAPDGTLHVRIDLITPAGENTYYLDGDSARNLGRELIKMGKAADAGLVIP